MTTPVEIQAALAKLDPANDNHWTSDGMPRLETIRMLASDQQLSRDAVTQAAPGFTRAAALNGAQPSAPVAAPVTPAVPPVTDPVAPQPPAATETAPIVPPVAGDDAQKAEEEDPQAELKEELATLDEKLVDMKAWKAKFEVEFAKTQARRDEVIVALEKAQPVHSNQQAIRDYLDSQVQQLEIRRQRQEATRGIDLRMLLPQRAPIDVSMQRKTGYGRNRPQVPVKK